MAPKRERPPMGSAGAMREDQLGRRIDGRDTAISTKLQAIRICAYTIDANLIVREVAYG